MKWALRVPAVPIAIAVSESVWVGFLATAPESQVKARLREGELAVPVIEPAAIERTLIEAGADQRTAASIAQATTNGADISLVEATVRAFLAAVVPQSKADDDRARSAAERFLFEFLESLPETAGRFELNATLDFKFGSRAAEVDFVCRVPRIALEIDGYFHFLDSEGYCGYVDFLN